MLEDENSEENKKLLMKKKMFQLQKVIQYLMFHLEERILACEYLHQKGHQKVDKLLDGTNKKLKTLFDSPLSIWRYADTPLVHIL